DSRAFFYGAVRSPLDIERVLAISRSCAATVVDELHVALEGAAARVGHGDLVDRAGAAGARADQRAGAVVDVEIVVAGAVGRERDGQRLAGGEIEAEPVLVGAGAHGAVDQRRRGLVVRRAQAVVRLDLVLARDAGHRLHRGIGIDDAAAAAAARAGESARGRLQVGDDLVH